ncbi:MAG: two-component system, NarL family, sensor histidine kinase DegS [Halanaerobiales bacterium]|nr:two-component system, NarL family, sensor histidine kinase DegS [Halanaerobiales bacterium]
MKNVSQSLEKILKKTIDVLDESKNDIFTIAESSRKEYENAKSELQLLNQDVNEVIDNLDRLERINKRARLRLMEVSRDFNRYSEADIKKAYQEAEESSVEIAVLREKEEQLKKRRRELEGRLKNLKENVEKAENLVSRMGVIRDFLLGELTNLNDHFDDLRKKENLAIKIIQAQEEERRRLARDIHDGPAQLIANLVFRVELTQKLLDKDLNKAKSELEELKNLIRLSMQDVRKIIYDLRPMSLDDLGLIPTLERYIDKYIGQTGIIIDFIVMGSKRRLPNTYEVTIFRLVQEALNNIYKHAKATGGKVRIEFKNERINIMISDDGIGFDSGEVEEDKYGLISMKERCELLGGEIEIKSAPNKGTVIKIVLPLKETEAVKII